MATRDELETRINEAHRRLFAAVAGFDDAILETEPVCGVWSARDVFGHLADWHREVLGALDYALAGAQHPRPIRDIESFNTTQAALRGIDSWANVVDDLRQAWENVIVRLDDVDETQLQRTGQLPSGRVERVDGFFGQIARHTGNHAEELEQWRLRRMGVRERDM